MFTQQVEKVIAEYVSTFVLALALPIQLTATLKDMIIWASSYICRVPSRLVFWLLIQAEPYDTLDLIIIITRVKMFISVMPSGQLRATPTPPAPQP